MSCDFPPCKDIGCTGDCGSVVITRTDEKELNCSGYKMVDVATSSQCVQQGNKWVCPMSISEITNYWQRNGSSCTDHYNYIIYSNLGSNTISPEGYTQVQQDLYHLLSVTLGPQGSNFNLTSNVGIQQSLYYACNDDFNMVGACQPWVCSELLAPYKNNPDAYDLMANNPALSDWLGCWIPPNDVDQLYPNADTAVIPNDDYCSAPCWTMCHRVGTLQLYTDEGVEYSCKSNICVIDDVVIDESESSTGSANINQVCTQCSPNELCKCIISSNSLSSTMQTLGIQNSYTQYCGNDGVCYQLESDGTLTPVDCTSYLGVGGGRAFSSSLPWIIFAIAIVIFLIFLAVFLALRKPKYYKEVLTNFELPADPTGAPPIYSWDIK